ncbi:hypothetical protein ADU59_00490 (plasmid) [Pararhizobium polonicum]|uniref:Heme-degrading domain-containing protein n=2 Tax=Pararhizobium polonicum TaxID=1612624 RepID=A0A1C7P8N9_9HYPH|nr:hypothetical protein ADU59_00490 [Pararhizobium polonicum]
MTESRGADNTMTYTLDGLAKEQQRILLHRFDYDFVWRLGLAIRQRAATTKAPVAITIAHGTDVAFSLLMPGSTPDNSDWAARKCAVAGRFHRSSLAMRLEAEQGKFDFNRRYRLDDTAFAASGGGVPLILRDGTLIGTVGVSGLPDVEDHQLIIDALQEILTKK